jgi:hypothetical protein
MAKATIYDSAGSANGAGVRLRCAGGETEDAGAAKPLAARAGRR